MVLSAPSLPVRCFFPEVTLFVEQNRHSVDKGKAENRLIQFLIDQRTLCPYNSGNMRVGAAKAVSQSKKSFPFFSDLFVACRRCAVPSMEVLVVDGRIKNYG
jgi:hypothetical protein